ncbi:hypothetical protein [Microvirga calopogonii]|uniref:hypothetical protein n=1 Tax=Microvirga calopogonii TaxID=2078013 RepID=UPI000E0DF9BF|nr:hypothetical protein [Microvirga calopogonii]
MSYSTLAAPSNIKIKVGDASPATNIHILENGQPGRIIGEVVFDGFDPDHSYTVSLVKPLEPDQLAVVPFEIVNGTGADAGKFFFKLKDGQTLDFEGSGVDNFDIKVTDNSLTGDNTTVRPIDCIVDNVVDGPTSITVNAQTTLAITENADPLNLGDILQTGGDDVGYTYTLVAAGGPGNPDADALAELFEISEDRLVQKVAFDREAFPGGTFTFKIKAEVVDGPSLTYEQTITVNVSNVNEAPTAIDFGTAGMSPLRSGGTPPPAPPSRPCARSIRM